LIPSTRKKTLSLLGIVAISTPLALAVETGLRMLLFPPEFEDLRMLLRPIITPYLWATPVLAVVFAFIGIRVQRVVVHKQLAKLSEDKRTPEAEAKAHFDALMLSSSCPQIPALMATFGFMFGSELLPVCVGIAVATAGVCVLGLVLPVPGTRSSPAT
jgi:hypothetical protein